MSVQLENGFTQIANELLEQIPFYKFNGTQFSLLIVIIRFTYGFNRKDHDISLTFLTKATGIKRNQVDRELNVLIEKNVVVIHKEATRTDSRRLGINKHYEQWEIERRCPLISGQSPKKGIPELEDTVSPNQSTEGVPYLGDKEIKSFKDINTTTEPYLILLDEYCSLHNKIEFHLKRAERDAMNKMVSSGMPLEFILTSMKTVYDSKKKEGSPVTSFLYYEKVIPDIWKRDNNVIPAQFGKSKKEPDWDNITKILEARFGEN